MLYAIVAVLALILDQAVKYWTTANIVLNTGEKPFIPGLIRLTNVHNDGAAFSILQGQRWFFVVLCIVFVAAIIYMLMKDFIKSPPARWTAVLVMAGAVGNCIDRVLNGYVVDMFELEFMNFPVFNVADIFITVCGILFCVFFLLEPSDDKAKNNIAKAAAALGDAEEPVKKTAPAKKVKRSKIVIPDFPQREKTEDPAIDPNDPFAEWERIAAGEVAAQVKKAEAQEETPDLAREVPAPAAEEAPVAEAPAAPVVQVAEQPEIHVQEIRSDDEPVAKPVEAAPKAEAKPAEVEISYNLDDILAEFRDL